MANLLTRTLKTSNPSPGAGIDLALASDIVERSLTCLRPVQDAEILPSEAYTSDAFWKFERKAIFDREWMCVGHVNEIPKPGDYLPISVLDEPLLLVRTKDGSVKALSAVCQHRGHPIVGGVSPAPANGGCLHAKRLVCPYHNWTYDLDGRLIGAPSIDVKVLTEQLRTTVRLPEIRSQIFHGLIFVTFNPAAPRLEDALKSLTPEIESYAIEALLPSHALIKTDLPWNWKLHHENAIEPYHTSFVHRGYHDAVPSHLTKFRPFAQGQGYVARSTGYADGDGDLFESGGGRRLPFIPTLSEDAKKQTLFVSIMPTVILVMQPTMITVTFINPISVSTMSSRRINLYPEQAMNDPEMEAVRDAQMEQMKVIIGQDQDTQTALQQAYNSRFAPRGRLAELETGIAQLNQWVVNRYRTALSTMGVDIAQATP
jgi:phenylpropionate dioxygenase-like ring-hydroxylating dioxygenase large terminal subunit